MEFDRSKVFTPFNADEVKCGSKGIVADRKVDLIEYVTRSNGQDLSELKDVDISPKCNLPFSVCIGLNTCHYEYFYLVEEPKEPKKRPCTREELLELLKKQELPMLKQYNDTIYLVDRLFSDVCFIDEVKFTYQEVCENYTLLDGTALWMEE